MMVIPPSSPGRTAQSPKQDWMHPHVTADVPQVFATQSTRKAPPARMRQIWPAAQVTEELGEQRKVPLLHGAVLTVHRGCALLPATQVAIVRPAPEQSS